MKTSIQHLPQSKQDTILRIVDVIKEVNPAKIILYGSHATGKWQSDQYGKKTITYDFDSDYDFLVVMKDDHLKTIDLTDRLENKSRTHAPINVLVQSIAYINQGLQRSQYFFIDIIKEGVLLFDSGEVEFSSPKELTPSERKEIAEEYYEYWFNSSREFRELAIIAFEKEIKEEKRFNNAIYLLFQAIEGFYSTVLLVTTGYKPKTHNLDKYRKLTRDLSEELDGLFSFNPKDRYDQELFDLLKRSYIGAKYKMDFKISKKEMDDLIKRTVKMEAIVERICLNKIKEFSE